MYIFNRWIKNYKSILTDIITGIGLFWLFVEIASYSTNESIDQYLKNIPVFICAFIIIFIISVIKNKPKTSFVYKLRNKDNFIEIKIGDAFNNDGSLVIPFNDEYDVSLGGNVKKAKSLQNKLISDYYSNKEEHLKTDIGQKVQLGGKFEIGTTIEIEQNGKTFYLVVNSKKKQNNRVESTIDDFLLSLSKLWEYIALESGRNRIVSIPLLGTNHGRIANFNRTIAIREIVHSYIESSKKLNIADKLIICIHPSDLKKGDINLDELEEYLKFSCKHFRVVNISNKQEGHEISDSKVIGIEN